MSQKELERRYRRLLACYPADHRQAYGEEMIGVLLTSAPEGTSRPSVADAADLIGGGIRTRLRRLRSADGDSPREWRDALAGLAVLAPLLMLARLASDYISDLTLWFAVRSSAAASASGFLHLLAAFERGTLLMMAAPVATLLALSIAPATGKRARALSALLVLVPAALFVTTLVSMATGFIRTPDMTPLLIGYSAVFAIEILAVACSCQSLRGWQILGRTRLVTLATSAICTATFMLVPATNISYDDVTFDAVLAIVAIGLTLTIHPRIGLRLLLLLLVPLYPILGVPIVQDASNWLNFGENHFVGQFIYLPTLALVVVACTVPWWSSRRPGHPRQP